MTDSDQLHMTVLFKFNDFNICLNYIRMTSYDIQYLGTYMWCESYKTIRSQQNKTQIISLV